MYISAISPMVSNLQTHTEQFRTCASFNHMMAANAGVIKAIVSFYTALIRIDGIRKTEKPYFDNWLKAPHSIPWSEGTNN